nr:MAG TPA: hypothetical protein [Crassvirales sp.]DAH06499.1 MAG TPA: hypothetical protein [Caudoviricetes sp.]DAP92740.1 MAG TPA: hypothetical protein [Caudoviricetes sp.]DAU41550.1 MAG TPA: hypothetical protein [Bacteriophage sp.]
MFSFILHFTSSYFTSTNYSEIKWSFSLFSK